MQLPGGQHLRDLIPQSTSQSDSGCVAQMDFPSHAYDPPLDYDADVDDSDEKGGLAATSGDLHAAPIRADADLHNATTSTAPDTKHVQYDLQQQLANIEIFNSGGYDAKTVSTLQHQD